MQHLMTVPTYSEISERWFYLRLPKGVSFAVHESDPALGERMKTARTIETFRHEFGDTAKELGANAPFPRSRDGLALLDAAITSELVHNLVMAADPDDPNNCFKLRLSEFAVFLGDVAADELGASWRFARFPNYHQSVVVCEEYEFLVWDTVMKRVSSDEGNRTLVGRYSAFEAVVLNRRHLSRRSHVDGTG